MKPVLLYAWHCVAVQMFALSESEALGYPPDMRWKIAGAALKTLRMACDVAVDFPPALRSRYLAGMVRRRIFRISRRFPPPKQQRLPLPPVRAESTITDRDHARAAAERSDREHEPGTQSGRRPPKEARQ